MMAHNSSEQAAPFRFAVPRSLQRFDMFLKFPYDVRHLIWEEVIFTPGIHFLKFVETGDAPGIRARAAAGANSGGSSATLLERRGEETQGVEDLVYSATLKPVFSFSSADTSHYITMNKTLARLRASCSEANHLVEKVLAQSDNLTLNNGQLVLLQRSSDVVCIDYPNMAHTRLPGTWAEHLDLGQLAKVRRLAVRYHHEWDDDLVCGYCGRVHSYHGRHPYPRHVYEFAALFKNLETFYFIDYLTVRKPQRAGRPSQAQHFDVPRERFASGEGGRTYFEADPSSCTTHTRVYETLAWLQSNYVMTCRRKSQGPSNPERVRFKVLACEWDADQKLLPTKHLGTQTTHIKRKRTKNHNSNPTTSSQNSSVTSGGPLHQPTNASALPVVFGDASRSKFEFTLEIPH
ncbi:hypothetical protein F4861DRAFT_16343 [Xylaria intraflava]|nr:hypothetical protein F4861DRAFT_16343 [Xylaria intraflava]